MTKKDAKANLKNLYTKKERIDLHAQALLNIINTHVEATHKQKDAGYFHYLQLKKELFQ